MRIIQRNKVSVWFTGSMYLYIGVLILFLPLRWIIAIVISSLIHELFHILAIYLLGFYINAVRIGIGGAVIETPEMSAKRELICALAGPLGGLSLLLFKKWLPVTAICAAFQSLYNLIPIYPLDGGRILQCCTRIMFSAKTAHHVAVIIEYIFLTCSALIGIYATFVVHLGIWPLIVTICLILSAKKNTLQSR